MDKKKRLRLKKSAHSLKPVILLGNKGLTNPVLAEIDLALDQHELIKIKLNAADRDEREALIEKICQVTGADLINSIGKVATVYRKFEEEA